MTNDRFRKQIEIDFLDANNEPIFETIDELKILMRRKGYRRVYNRREKMTINREPTQRQLQTAYFHITKKAQRVIEDYFSIDRYEGRESKRAIRNIFIKGKLYRKGQFLPKGEEPDE